MHTEREWPLYTHERSEIASVEKHGRGSSQKQLRALRARWHRAQCQAGCEHPCIPNSRSGSSGTHKLLSNKYQVQPVANTEMRAVLRINFCWAYLSWSYFPWWFHLMDYPWMLLICQSGQSYCWAIVRQLWIHCSLNAQREIFCSWRILQNMLKMWSILWPLNRQGQCSRYPSLIHRAACSLSSGLFFCKRNVIHWKQRKMSSPRGKCANIWCGLGARFQQLLLM